MNRYMIVIPAKNRSFVLECDEGDGAKPETLQKLVSGYVETVACGAGRHLGAGGSRPAGAAGGRGRPPEVQGREPEGHAACPGGRHGERQAAIVGAAVLMFQRGDKLLGFTKHVADTICSEWL